MGACGCSSEPKIIENNSRNLTNKENFQKKNKASNYSKEFIKRIKEIEAYRKRVQPQPAKYSFDIALKDSFALKLSRENLVDLQLAKIWIEI